jgi:O-antigen biosynthesis protein
MAFVKPAVRHDETLSDQLRTEGLTEDLTWKVATQQALQNGVPAETPAERTIGKPSRIRSKTVTFARRASRLFTRVCRKMIGRAGDVRAGDNQLNDEDSRQLAESGLFDGDWYLQQYPNVRAAGVNPILHYLRHGAGEGCDPNPLFDSDWYLEQNPDIRAAGVNPLLHYLQHGAGEGRDPNPLFDSDWYLEQNPDIRGAGVNPLLHYLQHGANGGGDPHPLFDGNWYLKQNPDVRAAGVNPLLHYLQHGAGEGRDPNPLFDSDWYLEQNPDVRDDGVNPLLHYLQHGASEGRAPGPRFDGDQYLDEYSDVRAAGMNPLAHYLRQGVTEGRHARSQSDRDKYTYQRWIEDYDTLSADDIAKLRQLSANLAKRPLISFVMPVYNTELRWLRAAIESVRSQIYPDWELCISDNASTRRGVREELRKYAELDDRIEVFFRDDNGHISANSNSALTLARGEFVALVDSDDILPIHALYWVAEEINAHPEADLIFSDEDKIDEEGRRVEPYFKPDWNPALMLSQNAFSHLGIYRRSLVEEVGGFRMGLEGSQDHDLVLRCAERCLPAHIRHIPRILYHWRAIASSSAASADAKPYAWTAGARAIEEHLVRKGIAGKVGRACTDYYQVDYQSSRETPKVSILIPSARILKLLRPCMTALLGRTTYSNFEVLVAVNEIEFRDSSQAAYLRELEREGRVRVLVYQDREFNYSRVNNWAAGQAEGSILCLMNDDVEVTTADWIEQFVARLQLDGVGAVGAMLYYPEGNIQHAGVTLGLGESLVAGHPYSGMRRGSRGYFGRAALEQDLSCVTAACVGLRREAFEQIGGFNEALAIAFNDVDLCMRLRENGWRIIWTPRVEHLHHESTTVGQPGRPERKERLLLEVELMHRLWGGKLATDPFHNPNLALRDGSIRLAFPPRQAKLTNRCERGGVQVAAEPVEAAKLSCFKPLENVAGARVALMTAHAPAGRLKPNVPIYIAALRRAGLKVVLIVAADQAPIVDSALSETLSGGFVRDIGGFDFAAWAHALKAAPELWRAETLFLVNDSVIGPLSQQRLDDLLRRVTESPADVVGATENFEIEWHLQSYFIAFKSRALASEALRSFFDRVQSITDKDAVVRAYEVPLTRLLTEAGLLCAPVYPSRDRANQTVVHWRDLIDEGFPFVKTVVLRVLDPHWDVLGWRETLACTGFDPEVAAATAAASRSPASPQAPVEMMTSSSSPNRRAVLVLGVHRSGTSAVAGVVHALGAAAPKTPLVPQNDNPRGFFESLPLYLAHNEVLASAGFNWEDWRQFNPLWFRSEAAERQRQKMKSLLIEEFADEPLILIKDPRICRFVPLMAAVLAESNIGSVAVLPIRNPLEVAYSLRRRDGIAPTKSILMWLRYVLDAEFYSRHMPRCFLAYEEFLTDWRHHVDRLAEKTGLAWPDRSDRSAAEIDDFLAPELRRERVSYDEFTQHPIITRWVREAYDILSEMAAGDENEHLLARLDAVRTEFDNACQVFGAALAEQEAATASMTAERNALAAAHDNLVHEHDALAREHKSLASAHDAVLGSRSWRLTAPLQAMRRLFTR